MRAFIREMEDKVLDGGEISADEALHLLDAEGADIMTLMAAANQIRQAYCGDGVHLCGIVNAKSGACSENCNFCAQSAAHPTGIQAYSLMDEESLVEASHTAIANGARNFGIVTAWRGIRKGKSLDTICAAIRRIKAEGRTVPDVSLGIIDDPEVPRMLVEAGAVEYNHNLETGRSYYPKICTTHSYEERVRTIRLCKEAGLLVCSGGIFGLGESNEHRVELATALRELDVHTTPLNFYHHTHGNNVDTSRITRLKPMEALKIVAVFRFVLPKNVLKVAGGRELILGQLQPLMFMAGANSTMIGHYLTTNGRKAEDDFELIGDLGMHVAESCSPARQSELLAARV